MSAQCYTQIASLATCITRFNFGHHPLQALAFYKLTVVELNPANHCQDSWGLKRLFSHGLRRWLSGASQPRETWKSWFFLGVLFLSFFLEELVLFERPASNG